MKRFIAIWILLSAGLNIWQMDRIRNLEEKKPIASQLVIYKADNAGAEIFGKVLEKGRHGKLYTIVFQVGQLVLHTAKSIIKDENLLGSNGTFAIDGHKFEIKISEVSEKEDLV